MAMEFDAPADLGGGNFLETPGTYHCVVSQVLEGQGPTGKMIQGFTVSLEVLDGDAADGQPCAEVGKSLNLCFFNGKLSDKDQGKFAFQKQAAFLIASGVMAPSQLGSKVSIELQNAVGSQVVVTLAADQEGKYLQLDGARIYHVDDPRAAKFRKDAESLKLIDASRRHGADYFDAIVHRGKKSAGGATGNTTGNSGGSAGGQTKSPTKQQPVGAGASGNGSVNFDDL